MRRELPFGSILLCILTVALLASCGGTSTSPSIQPEVAAQGAEVAAQGATLTGRFQDNGLGASFGLASGLASERGIEVSDMDTLTVIVLDKVTGQEITRTEVVDGTFTLRGLPDAFVLSFVDAEGNEVGEIPFEGVKPNQEIDIVVDLVDGAVVLVDEQRTGIDHEGASGIELEGSVEYVNIDSSDDPMTGSVGVDGRHVETRAGETSIRHGNRSLTLEQLELGDLVHVRGVIEEGNVVFAFEIKLREEEEEEEEKDPSEICQLDPAKSNHILVCHKEKILSIPPDAWPAHQGHGDTCAPC